MEGLEPAYRIGQGVRVVPGRGHTPRRGTVRQVIWHHKDGCFHYYIEEAGRRVSKRYQAADLEVDDEQSPKPNQ